MDRHRMQTLGALAVLSLVASSCSMWGWGANSAGQAGIYSNVDDVDTPTASSPSLLTALWDQMATGFEHSCGITKRGALWCWGGNTHGQLGLGPGVYNHREQVGSDTDWQAVTAGDFHTCALKGAAPSDLYCWGRNNQGQLGDGTTTSRSSPTIIATSFAGFRAVDAGDRHTCAHAAGNGVALDFLTCWGDNASGQLGDGTTSDRSTPTTIITTDSQSPMTISAGGSHTCVGLMLLGSLASSMQCFGANTYGQLGDGTTTDRLAPVSTGPTVGGLFTATPLQIAAGTDHTCVVGDILIGDAVFCTGRNQLGQLGDGNAPTSRSDWGTPVFGVASDREVSSLASGTWHTCASQTQNDGDRGLYCWGANGFGQLGTGDTADRDTPTLVASGYWSSIASQDAHTCARRAAGYPECWGFNGAGGLGDGTTTNQTSPTPIEGDLIDLDIGPSHGCRVLLDGSLECWGSNDFGQLGLNDTSARNGPWPVSVSGDPTFTDVEVGGRNSCALTDNSVLYCSGVLGVGLTFSQLSSLAYDVSLAHRPLTPSPVDYVCVIIDAVVPTGSSDRLLCGEDDSVAVPVNNDGDWADVEAAGGGFECARKDDRTLWCRGENDQGQLGVGDTAARADMTQIGTDSDWGMFSVAGDAGSGTVCAIKTDGTLWCWGRNSSGQLGIGSLTDQSTPQQVGTATDWTHISVATGHVCGIRNGSDPWCWGNNASGQLGDGTTANSSVPIAVEVSDASVQIEVGGATTVTRNGVG